MTTTTKCQVHGSHCSLCGQPCRGNAQNQGYSECCNERITDPSDCDNFHGREAAFQAALDEATAAKGYESREAWIAAEGEAAFDRAADALFDRCYN